MSSVAALSDLLDIKEIFYTNVLLLGFDSQGHEEKYRIPFNVDMFVLPNKKGMEVIMHYLFSRLDSHLCYEEFRDCWPVSDKKQEQQFRKTCTSWLAQIAKENKELRIPRIVSSLFMSPGGNRFYEFLVYFSDYVLVQAASREGGRFARCPSVPAIDRTNFTLTHVMAKATMCHSLRERQRFLDASQQLVAAQKEWMACATELTHEYRKLSKAVREQESKMNSYIASQRDKLLLRPSNPKNVSSGSRSADFYLETARKQRATKMQQVRKYWQTLEAYHKNSTPERQVVQSILDGNTQKHGTDAADIQVQVPGLLLPECQQQLDKGELNNIYQNGKLDLLSLVQLWGLSLNTLKDKLQESEIPDLGKLQAEIATHVHTHHGQLADAKVMNTTLSQLLPELKRSIAALDAQLDSEVKKFEQLKSTEMLSMQPRSHRRGNAMMSQLDLLAATPEVTPLNPSASPLTDESNMRPMRRTTDTTSTPQAIRHLTATVENATTNRVSKPAKTTRIPINVERHHREDETTSTLLRVSTEMGSSTKPRLKKEVAKLTKRQTQRGKQQETTKQQHKIVGRTTRSERKDRTTSHQIKVGRRHDVTMPLKTPSDRRNLSTRNVTQMPSMPKAQLLLADQIASYVAGSPESEMNASADSTPSHNLMHSLADPSSALGQEAFLPRDKLTRTPAPPRHPSQAITDSSPLDGILHQPKMATSELAHHTTASPDLQAEHSESNPQECSSSHPQPTGHQQRFTLLPPSAFTTPSVLSSHSNTSSRQTKAFPPHTPVTSQTETLHAVTPGLLVFSEESSPCVSGLVDSSGEGGTMQSAPQDASLLISFESEVDINKQEVPPSVVTPFSVVPSTSSVLLTNSGNLIVSQTRNVSSQDAVQVTRPLCRDTMEHAQLIRTDQLDVTIERVHSSLTAQHVSPAARDVEQPVGMSSVLPRGPTSCASTDANALQTERLNEAYLTGQFECEGTTPQEAHSLWREDVQSSASSLISIWSNQPLAQTHTTSPSLRGSPISLAQPRVGHLDGDDGGSVEGLSPLSSLSGQQTDRHHQAGLWSDDDNLLADESLPSLVSSQSPGSLTRRLSFQGKNVSNESYSSDTKLLPPKQASSGGIVDLLSQLSLSPLSSVTSTNSDHVNQ